VVHDPYNQLARKLDALPNGFPPTESGVELRLLAKLFTPQEAALAAAMHLRREPSRVIAERIELAPDEARTILKDMVRKGLIRVRRGEGELLFSLMPFVVGFYEEQLPRMDEELATLVEEYLQETAGGAITRDQPALHRVIPVEQAIPFELEIFPHERASQLLENAKSWGVRDCICRVQQRLLDQGCGYPVENCISFAPVAHAFDHSTVTRAIDKEEALQILAEAQQAGLIHSTGNYVEPHYYICNCCTCCCGILRGVAEFGVPTAVAKADFRAVVDAELCTGCEACLDRCQFSALTVEQAACVVEDARCVGCGLCVTTCPAEALHLERRSVGELPQPPQDIKAWGAERMRRRGAGRPEAHSGS